MSRPRTARDSPPSPGPGVRGVAPLLAVVALVVVVALAARRGDRPRVDSGAATQVLGAEETPAPSPGDAPPAGDATAEVLGTSETPRPQPTPTARVEDLPTSGSGTFVHAAAGRRSVGHAPYRRYRVAVEDGSGADLGELTRLVQRTLGDDRSWIGDGVTGFVRVGADDPADFTIVVATPDTVDALCAPLRTQGRYSCGTNGFIALNLHRWMTATEDWPSTLSEYRRYLVNHEVGHYVLGPDHATCPAPGMPAPIMVQQTIDLQGCVANGWVYPD